MCKRLLFLFCALALLAPLTRAQEAAEAKPDEAAKPARTFGKAPNPPAATPAPAPTPAPVRKRGFFHRLFGGGGRPAPTPVPATPAPIKHRPRRPVPAPVTDDSKPPVAKVDEPKGDGKPTPENPSATPVPKTGHGKGALPKASVEQKALDRAVAGGDPDAIEKAKYDEVRTRAVADPKVAELQSKADAAGTEEESRAALRAYNKALFDKMRTLEPSIEPRIDRMEAAVLKRLGE